jgi:hypothetical protein
VRYAAYFAPTVNFGAATEKKQEAFRAQQRQDYYAEKHASAQHHAQQQRALSQTMAPTNVSRRIVTSQSPAAPSVDRPPLAPNYASRANTNNNTAVLQGLGLGLGG